MNVNLTIHDVTDNFDSGFNTSKYRYYILSNDQFLKLIDLILKLKNHNIQTNLTIDDGGKSNVYIAEELYKQNIVATFFITTKYINSNRFLNKEEIKYISSLGHIIGAHSHSHLIPFEHLSYSEQLIEWSDSINILSELLNKPVDTISFPGGGFNNNTLQILKSLGIKSAYSSIPNPFLKFHNKIELYGRFCIVSKTDLDYLYCLITKKKYIFKYYILIYNLKRFIKSKFPYFAKIYTSKYI